LLDATVAHHRDAVRQRERFGLRVRDENESDADIALQADEFDLHLLAQFRIERAERLVEEQQARPVHERARERHALLLPAREFVRIAFHFVFEVHLGERLAHFRLDLVRVLFRHLERKRDVLRDAHVREQRIALEHSVHRALFRGLVGQVLAFEQYAARVGRVESRDHAQ